MHACGKERVRECESVRQKLRMKASHSLELHTHRVLYMSSDRRRWMESESEHDLCQMVHFHIIFMCSNIEKVFGVSFVA